MSDVVIMLQTFTEAPADFRALPQREPQAQMRDGVLALGPQRKQAWEGCYQVPKGWGSRERWGSEGGLAQGRRDQLGPEPENSDTGHPLPFCVP